MQRLKRYGRHWELNVQDEGNQRATQNCKTRRAQQIATQRQKKLDSKLQGKGARQNTRQNPTNL